MKKETSMTVLQNRIRRQRNKIAAVDILSRRYFAAREANRHAEGNLPQNLAILLQRWNLNLKRTMWTITWFTLFAACAYQIVERVTLFMDDPSSIKNDYQINKTIIFPSVLFCPDVDLNNPVSIHSLLRQQFEINSTNELDQMLRVGNITVFDVWNATGQSIQKVEAYLHQTENPRRKLFDVTKIYTPQGLCHNVVPLENLEFKALPLTVELILSGDLKHLPNVGIMSHSEKDFTLTKYLLLTGMQRHKTTADFSYMIRPNQVMRRNSRSHPCADDKYVTKCFFNCLLTHVHSALHSPWCRLPFMDEFYDVPLCNKFDDITNTMQTFLNSVVNFSRNHCLCPQVCHETIYQTTDYNYISLVDSNWRCFIVIAQNVILTSQEAISYRWFSLCCDLAGALGLWLGICLLQILETGTDYFSRILTVCKRKRSCQIMDAGTNSLMLRSMRNRDLREVKVHVVDVAGVRKVLARNSLMGTRISWSIMTVVSLCFSLYLCAVRISHYLNNPTATILYYYPIKNLEFPVITFCPEPPKGILPAVDLYRLREKLGKEISLNDILLLLETEKIAVNEIWEIPSIRLSDYANAMTKHNNTLKEFNWSFTHTVVGRCISVTSYDEEAIQAIEGKHLNVWFYKRLVYAPYVKDFRIILHGKEDYRALKYLPKYDGYSFLTKHYDEFRIQFIEIKRPIPCESKQNYSYCIANCIEEAVFKTVSNACRLPYMQEDFTIPECYTAGEFIEVMNATSNILKTINFENCGCPRPCNNFLYTLSTRKNDILKIESDYAFKTSFIIFEENHQVLEEYAADNIISLISDLGGALSLFLGLCGFQVAKIILQLVTSNKTHCQTQTLRMSKRYQKQIDTTSEKLKKSVNSSGFEHKKNCPFWIRILYFLVCIIVSVLCVSQCAERITYFWTDPSDVITYHAYNDSILFPVITIQPSAFAEDDAINDVMKMNPLFKIHGVFVNDVPTDDVTIFKVRNMYGIGLSIKPRNPFSCIGEKCTMNVILDVHTAMEYSVFHGVIAMHSAEDFYYNPYSKEGQGILRSTKLVLKIIQLSYRNTSKNPCTDGVTATKCAIDCFEKHIFSNITGKCRGPYAQGFKHIPECKENEELYKMEEYAFWISLRDFDVENSAFRCFCPRRCASIWYSYIADEKTNFNRYENITRISINFLDKLVFVIREEPAYTFFKLLSDLGGTVGLYFGFGIFQMLQILEDLFGYFKRLTFKKIFKKDLGYRNYRHRPIAPDHHYYYS